MSALVTVIIPVYNCEKYIISSIESILNQTYQNLEILVMDDGSSDRSLALLQTLKDPRLKVFSQKNQGLAKTLNTLIGMSSGEFIARQDQDDISLPKRIEHQVRFMTAHPRVGLLGTWSQIYQDDEPTERYHRPPTRNQDLKLFLYFDNPFVHTSVLIRKKALEEVGLYRWERELQPEDYELWQRMSEKYEISNLPEVLVHYREVAKSMSRANAMPFPYLKNLAADFTHRRHRLLVPKVFASRFQTNEENLKSVLVNLWILAVICLSTKSTNCSFVRIKLYSIKNTIRNFWKKIGYQ